MTDRKAIAVGDLVMVVRVCCDLALKHGVRMGLPWTVIAVEPSQHGRCPKCGGNCPGRWARKSNERFGWSGAPFSWLKRIPPLDELETEKRDEEITA